VIHTIHPDNHASIRLAERLGSCHRGPAALPPPHQDIPAQVWAQSRAQWMQRRADAGGHVDVTTSGEAD
jgi:RimJ/RimL family protein N-acetyltransferase